MVVVMRVDRATIRAPTATAVSTKRWGGMSRPRSIISNPEASSMIFTRFLPMSWVSPSTTPITTLGFARCSSRFRWGWSTASPEYMASEQSSSSGMK